MLTVLIIIPREISYVGFINKRTIDLEHASSISIVENNKIHTYYLYHNDITGSHHIGNYSSKKEVAEELSKITIILNHSRISFEYTKDFVK